MNQVRLTPLIAIQQTGFYSNNYYYPILSSIFIYFHFYYLLFSSDSDSESQSEDSSSESSSESSKSESQSSSESEEEVPPHSPYLSQIKYLSLSFKYIILYTHQ